MNERQLRTIVIVCVCYIAAQIFADITSLRIILIAGFAVDAGTLVYPFTFTLRDLVHKTAGISLARTLIFLAAIINIFMAFLFWIVSIWSAPLDAGPQTDLFGTVLSPVFRIVFASIVAEVISELLDTEAYRLWERRFGAKYQWGRVLASNLVSVPIDSAIFVVIAFVGDLPLSLVWEIFLLNIIIKGIVTLISIPGIYLVRGQKEENHPEAA